jgi:hypothetical protein
LYKTQPEAESKEKNMVKGTPYIENMYNLNINIQCICIMYYERDNFSFFAIPGGGGVQADSSGQK